ncbi:hypothetical protein [Pseudoalteromonas prydzensis]|uniref:hypothetical protein n=1 Tax=Pseudoalteromonas prydzensis TaxID=182141 RepID=UPI003FCF53AC
MLVKNVFTKSGELKSIFRMRADYTKTNQSRDCALVLKQQRQAILAWRDRRIKDKAMLSLDGSYGGLNGYSPLFLAKSGKRWVTLSFNVNYISFIKYTPIKCFDINIVYRLKKHIKHH